MPNTTYKMITDFQAVFFKKDFHYKIRFVIKTCSASQKVIDISLVFHNFDFFDDSI